MSMLTLKFTTRFFFRGFLLVLAILWACVDKFDAGSIAYTDQLVVDGLITNEFKQHQVKISHTSSINDEKFIPETGALVSVSDKGGQTIPLTESSPGVYLTPFFA